MSMAQQFHSGRGQGPPPEFQARDPREERPPPAGHGPFYGSNTGLYRNQQPVVRPAPVFREAPRIRPPLPRPYANILASET